MALKIAFLSAGLGNVSRGFETSTENWFRAVQNSPIFDARLFSGGNIKNGTRVVNLARNGFLTSLLRRIGLVNDGCKLEQLTFGLGFLVQILRFKPDIIWLQEGVLADLLLKYKKVFRFDYKIVFCDGAPVGYKFADKFDYIMFLHKFAYDEAITGGVNKGKATVLPLISTFPSQKIAKSEARTFFNLPQNSLVIICVAAWNNHHKRINYLLQEVAELKIENLQLLLCGQAEKETASLQHMAAELGINAHWHTLNSSDLAIAYSAADLFVLPSLNEGFGIVLIEAAAHHLPVICHPHNGGKFIFGEDYIGLTDLSKPGSLKSKVEEFLNSSLEEIGKAASEKVYRNFGKEQLTKKFEEIMIKVSKNEPV